MKLFINKIKKNNKKKKKKICSLNLLSQLYWSQQRSNILAYLISFDKKIRKAVTLNRKQTLALTE